MATYLQLLFEDIQEEQAGIIIAELSLLGFEGFEESKTSIKAFIPESDFEKEELDALALKMKLSFTTTTIQETNWNAVWESNFAPVIVEDFAGIRAHFHAPITNVQHEILITPKMSFGTGHHATTHLMIQQMKFLNFANKQVFDFGTGTGVLAILAEKLGATNVVAVDNDDWSIENTTENVTKNNCQHIAIHKANDANSNQHFNIILANINRNVLLENMAALNQQLLPNGELLMSGLLVSDEAALQAAAQKVGLHFQNTWQRNGWICMLFTK